MTHIETLDNMTDTENACREALAALELHLVSALRAVEAGKLPRADILRNAARIDHIIRTALELADNPGDARVLRDWLVTTTEPGLPDSPSIRRLVAVVNDLVEERHGVC